MKRELTPKYTQRIENNYVLWFDGSNSYVVISASVYLLLTCYFKFNNRNTFVDHLINNFDIEDEQAQAYFIDFSNFLSDVHNSTEKPGNNTSISSIPKANISKYYNFGDTKIIINYASEKLLHLIHPYLEHTLVDTFDVAEAEFDIFKDGTLLYLFKNKAFIGTYETFDFHFLQGKFAMELLTSIYRNSESDWMATFHASTVCNNNEAIMIIGDSGNGKSTLSALLMAHGFDLLADDFTPMLSDNQELYRFPAAISIKKGAFKMVETLFDGFDKSNAHVSSSKQTSVRYLPPSSSFKTSKKHFKCQKLVMVTYENSAASELKECAPEKILQTFIPDSWVSPNPEHAKQFLNWLKDLKFYELIYSNNDFAVEKFKELFNQ